MPLVRLLLALIASCLLGAAASAGGWKVDAASSSLRFQSGFDGRPVEGHFRNWNAQIVFDPDALEKARFRVTIDLASVSTGEDEQDGALIGPEWFDALRIPTAVFESSRFERLAQGRYVAHGTLSIRGTSKPLSVPFSAEVSASGARLSGAAKLNRSEFGIGSGDWASGAVVPLEVLVSFEVNAAPNRK